jgi:hypothetical protein
MARRCDLDRAVVLAAQVVDAGLAPDDRVSDVADRDAARGPTLFPAVVGVALHGQVRVGGVDDGSESRRSQCREESPGFALEGVGDGGVVGQRNPDIAVQPGQHRGEAVGSIVGGRVVESAIEPHGSGDPYPQAADGHDGASALEHEPARGGDRRADTCRADAAAEVVMVAQDRDHGQAQITDLVDKAGGLLGGGSLSEVTGQEQHVGVVP